MKLDHKLILVLAMAPILASNEAFADEEKDTQAAQSAAAVWVEPVVGARASWVDDAPGAIIAPEREIVDAGGGFVLMKQGGMYVAADSALHGALPLAVPENVTWLAIDEKARIHAFDGHQLYFAESPEKAQAAEGFVSVLPMEGVTKLDHVSSTIVYADKTALTFADLDQMKSVKMSLADFFDDAKVAAMAPEAVASKKKKAKAPKKEADASSTENGALSAIEVQTIAARHDGVVVIKLRQMLRTRTFVTRDNGRSWRLMEEAPNTIVRQLGWIWDGKSRVLSADASSWLEVCAGKLDVTARFMPTQTPSAQAAVNITSSWPASPERVVDEASGPKPSEAACVPVEAIPVLKSESREDEPLAVNYLSPRPRTRTGTRYYFTNEGTSEGPSARLWKVPSTGNAVEAVELPRGCEPVFVESERGLGVLLCRNSEKPDQLAVYTQAASTGWFAETTVPAAIGAETKLLMSEDGTLVLTGACEVIETPAEETKLDAEGNVVEEAREAATSHLCTAAVRSNVEVGEPDAWRVERVHEAVAFAPVGDGRVLALVANADNTRSVVEATPSETRTLVAAFDDSVYDGLEMTGEGCLALYDKNNAEDASRLLTANGTLSNVTCSAAREIAIARKDEIPEAENAIGEIRYGLRAGAGAFIASGVTTWSARVEALFPFYGGQYEVGAVFRMAGGNVSSSLGYLGIVAIRWRYDQFELFDFAVGAGIGYGQLTGHSKKTEENEEGNVVETDESSSYAKTHTASVRYMISGIAAYKFSDNWKLYINAELIGGSSWGFDVGGGLEVRF